MQGLVFRVYGLTLNYHNLLLCRVPRMSVFGLDMKILIPKA